MGETWGRGTVFGVMPLSDGRVYCYAAAPAAAGAHAGAELAELTRLFGGWHEPIPALLAGTDADDLPRALAAYTSARLPRTTQVVRWSRRAATMTTWTARPAVAARNTVLRVAGKVAPGALLGGLGPIYGWQPQSEE